MQPTDIRRTQAYMGEVSTVSKRGGCGAKYRNRIMSFLSMLHRFHISPASLVAPSPCHSSSHPPPFPLNGPNISLEPLSCIKEIYYTRNFRLCDGSEIFFFLFPPQTKNISTGSGSRILDNFLTSSAEYFSLSDHVRARIQIISAHLSKKR